jgi:hypothetical protein
MSLLGDLVASRDASSVPKVSGERTGEGGESKEPGMGCERRVGKTRDGRDEEAVAL